MEEFNLHYQMEGAEPATVKRVSIEAAMAVFIQLWQSTIAGDLVRAEIKEKQSGKVYLSFTREGIS